MTAQNKAPWDKYDRERVAMAKARPNPELAKEVQAWWKWITGNCEDNEIINDTYLRLSSEFPTEPVKSFIDVWMAMYDKLLRLRRLDNNIEKRMYYGLDISTEADPEEEEE